MNSSAGLVNRISLNFFTTKLRSVARNGKLNGRLSLGERMDIKLIVKDNEVHFSRYRKGYAYYTVSVPPDNALYSFPVPIADIGDGTLLATDKALVFMRYIRAALQEGTFVKEQ
jgi:hypothetical protein